MSDSPARRLTRLRTENEAGTHLFDLSSDPGERTNLIGARTGVVADLQGRLAAWEREMLPPVPLEERYR